MIKWPGWIVLFTTTIAAENPPGLNRLAKETSPYLRLHARNPVDWRPWGPEALAEAKRRDCPILLSIGYSACHWCHVMNRESFDDAETAKLLNAEFVCIKVDREERPDVDMLYMEAVRSMTGQSGWPLTAFLLPDGRPFAGGTYFPPEDRIDGDGQVAMFGFRTVLKRVLSAFKNQRGDLQTFADRVAEHLNRQSLSPKSATAQLSRETISATLDEIRNRFDPVHGGLARPPAFAPKFPQTCIGQFVLESAGPGDEAALSAVAKQIREMVAGGIFDQIAGGIHRYSVDREWIVPHFEKMLYDQGQFLSLLAAAHRRTPTPWIRRTAELTVEFLAREMLDADGLFFSALDADSEHEEGKFYVWSPEELHELLGADADWFRRMSRTDGSPAFEGKHVIRLDAEMMDRGFNDKATNERWEICRRRLLASRSFRVRPRTDEKKITAWNGMAIVGLAEVAQEFHLASAREMAIRAADAITLCLLNERGSLARHVIGGKATGVAFADDYGAAIVGLLAAQRLEPKVDRVAAAVRLGDALWADFWDPALRRLNYSGRRHESLLAPLRDNHDGVMPSASSLAALAFVELARQTGESRFADRAAEVVRSETFAAMHNPLSATALLTAWRRLEGLPKSPAGQSRDSAIVAARVKPQPIILRAGESTAATLEIDIGAGWHIQANPASPEYLRPTIVRLKESANVRLLDVKYPIGTLLRIGGIDDEATTYAGKAEIVVQLEPAPEATPGRLLLKLTLEYQACDDRRCLAPTTIEIPVEAKILGP